MELHGGIQVAQKVFTLIVFQVETFFYLLHLQVGGVLAAQYLGAGRGGCQDGDRPSVLSGKRRLVLHLGQTLRGIHIAHFSCLQIALIVDRNLKIAHKRVTLVIQKTLGVLRTTVCDRLCPLYQLTHEVIVLFFYLVGIRRFLSQDQPVICCCRIPASIDHNRFQLLALL